MRGGESVYNREREYKMAYVLTPFIEFSVHRFRRLPRLPIVSAPCVKELSSELDIVYARQPVLQFQWS